MAADDGHDGGDRIDGDAVPVPSQQWPYQINTIYWDDALLRSSAAAQPTDAPPRDERVVHTVQPGETLDSIAFSYGKTREELLAINNIADPRIIQIGQEIIISLPPTPTPTATPVGAELTAAAPTGIPTLIPEVRDAAPAPVSVASGDGAHPIDPAQTTGSICVTFFEDANQNRLQDNGEIGAGGRSSAADASGRAGRSNRGRR